jgi:virginiamycin B lyase
MYGTDARASRIATTGKRSLCRSSLCAAAALVALALPAAAAELPQGPGRGKVERYCVRCHGLATVERGGYSRAAWRNNVQMMINVGARVPKDEVEGLVDYLAANLPERARPGPALLAGGAKAVFHEWEVPTPGTRPHDPYAAPDGALWYTGQFANVLGRRDPKTGAIREYALTTPDSGPHGLAMDRDGNVWFTANFKGYIGKLDPRTGAVTEYPMPDPAARDPHTPVFDAAGILWFTVQSGNFVGRLDPATGAVKLARPPTARALPYGIAVNAKGIPYFVEFGANKVGRIDPHTMEIAEYVLPDARSRPRRIAITGDGAVWFTDYALGRIGRLDPASGHVNEWPSPGGPEARPYAIAAEGEVLWYCETGVEPNTLVRFDPRMQSFQTWAIPAGGGVVRNMMLGPGGRLALAESGVNRIAFVDTK